MRVLVLCDSDKKCPIKPHIAGAFAEAFLDALGIDDPHTIAYNRSFNSNEANCFIFDHYPGTLGTLFKNHRPDWVFGFRPVNDTPEQELVLITRPQHVSADDTKRVINMLRLAIPDACAGLTISLEEITDMYNGRIDDLLDENLKLKVKISRLSPELDAKDLLITNG